MFRESIDLTDFFSVLKVSGIDAIEYLNRQTTSVIHQDHNTLGGKFDCTKNFHLHCLLNQTGVIESLFSVSNVSSSQADDQILYLVVEKPHLKQTIERIEKFVITEDVQISEVSNFQLVFDFQALTKINQNNILCANVWNLPACLILDGSNFIEIPQTKNSEAEKSYQIINQLKCQTGFPDSQHSYVGQRITETPLTLTALDLNKGCFLGFETVSKIESNRGGSKVTGLLEFLEESDWKEIKDSGKCINSAFPYHLITVKRSEAPNIKTLFPSAKKIQIFEENEPLEVFCRKVHDQYAFEYANDQISLNELSGIMNGLIHINPRFFDAYESLAVANQNEGQFEASLELLNRWKELDEQNPLVFTNLSMVHMKMGNIDIAEEYKESSLKVSIDQSAQSYKNEQREQEEIERRKEMFTEVLSIDENDAIANYGLADIYFQAGSYQKALNHLKQIIDKKEKNADFFILEAQVYLKLNQKNESVDSIKAAKKLLEKNFNPKQLEKLDFIESLIRKNK